MAREEIDQLPSLRLREREQRDLKGETPLELQAERTLPCIIPAFEFIPADFLRSPSMESDGEVAQPSRRRPPQTVRKNNQGLGVK